MDPGDASRHAPAPYTALPFLAAPLCDYRLPLHCSPGQPAAMHKSYSSPPLARRSRLPHSAMMPPKDCACPPPRHDPPLYLAFGMAPNTTNEPQVSYLM